MRRDVSQQKGLGRDKRDSTQVHTALLLSYTRTKTGLIINYI